MLKDISSSAAALYDGGWRSADADQLRTEYDLTEEETQELCAALANLEEKINNIHPAHAGGAFLLPYCNTAAYKRLQRLLYHPCSYTANAAKRHTALCRGFSCYLPHFTAANNKPIQAAIIPPAPRWSVSQRRNTSSTYQIPASRPDAVQPSTAALL